MATSEVDEIRNRSTMKARKHVFTIPMSFDSFPECILHN